MAARERFLRVNKRHLNPHVHAHKLMHKQSCLKERSFT